jgi:hypothetical protein
MKKITGNVVTFLGSMAAIIMITACSSNEDINNNSSSQAVKVTVTIDNGQTRATENTLNNLTDFGLYVNSDANSYNWQKSKVTYADGTCTLAETMKWNGDNTVQVIAIAPYENDNRVMYKTDTNSCNSIYLSSDITEGTEPIDYLYFYKVGTLSNILDSNDKLPVTFSHALSRLRIKVNMDNSIAGYSVKQITINGCYYDGNFDLDAGKISTSTNGQAIYATHTGENDATTWSTFIVPQTLMANQMKVNIILEKDGEKDRTYTYTYSQKATLEINKSYLLTLTLGPSATEVASDGIILTGWGEAADETDL